MRMLPRQRCDTPFTNLYYVAKTLTGASSTGNVSFHRSATSDPLKTSCSTCRTSSTKTNSIPSLTLSGTFSSISDRQAEGTISSEVASDQAQPCKRSKLTLNPCSMCGETDTDGQQTFHERKGALYIFSFSPPTGNT